SQRFVVFLPVGRSVFRFGWCTHPVSLPVAQLGRRRDGFVQQSRVSENENALLVPTGNEERIGKAFQTCLPLRFIRRNLTNTTYNLTNIIYI
ncbi:hypothetical protein, partial [Telluria antibiotica]|uniref:hypothetical protein n=1 Tax=Telluria antibiotica TaxID=2717319 RepID=UPI001AAFADEE